MSVSEDSATPGTEISLALLDYPDEYRLRAAFTEQPSVLVVDDNEANLQAMAWVLESLPCHLVLARSGMDALRYVLTQEFACILLDVQMPEMDGFETARLIHSRDFSRHVPILFVTAIHQTQAHVDRGYALGAVDYLFKPVSAETLRTKVRVFLELYSRQARAEERAQHQQLQRELEYARGIQARILPQDLNFEDLGVFARVLPARTVGGDFYDLLRLARREPVFMGTVGDVAGRGMPAALTMVMVLTLLRELASRTTRPELVLRQANERIYKRFSVGEPNLISAGTFSVDCRRRVIRYANAGHEPLLLWRRERRQVETVSASGMVLGAAPQQTYTAVNVPFLAGDRLICLTDGISEARSPAGDVFGLERLVAAVERYGADPLDRLGDGLLDLVAEFEQPRRERDDVCLFILELR